MKEYRIVPYAPYAYYVEVKCYYTKRLFWWKSYHECWESANIEGGAVGEKSICRQNNGNTSLWMPPPLLPFYTHAEAERQIRQFHGAATLKTIPNEFVL